MSRKLLFPFVLIICACCLTSCSILMIRNENERREKVAQDHIGWTQEELEKFWGPSVATANHSDGSKTCIYEFKRPARISKEPEKDLILLDVLFLGTMEIALVPATFAGIYVEEKVAPKIRGFVTYDLEGRVKEERCIPID